MRGTLLGLALVALAGAAAAEAPGESLRPAVRPGVQALQGETPDGEVPARPAARPVADAGGGAAPGPLVLEVEPPARPGEALVAPDAPTPPTAPEETGAPSAAPARDHLPFVARRPPLLRPDPEAPRLLGPRQVVRAEEAMGPPLPIPVRVDGWEGIEPQPRPALQPPAEPQPDQPTLRPRPRPSGAATPPLPAEPAEPPAYAPSDRPAFVPEAGVTPLAVAEAALPLPRPRGILERARSLAAKAARGQVCGNPLIQGEAEASFGERGGCGIEDPVRVRSVDGVRLSSAALMDCATAEALLTWVRTGARPALAGRGGGLARIDVMGDYACRPRNNQSGQRLSEHGQGRAIDVGGLTLADGSSITVLGDWPGNGLRQMHGAACGPFSTVLGPEANAFHRNHFHFDTARGRGPYCR